MQAPWLTTERVQEGNSKVSVWLHRQQWRACCSSGRLNLQLLDSVEDRAWVVEQCLHAVALDGTSQAKLIGMGLAETEGWARAEASSYSADSPKIEDHQGLGTDLASQTAKQTHEAYAHTPTSSASIATIREPAAEMLTESFAKDSVGSSSSAACKWRVQRLSLLRHMARLQTHLDISYGYAPLTAPHF